MSVARGTLFRVPQISDNDNTIGVLKINFNGEQFSCFTLEPHSADNMENNSSIPCGEYLVEKRYSSSYGEHLSVNTAGTDRSNVFIHPFNHASESKGCIALGNTIGINERNGLKAVRHSRQTLDDCLEFLKKADRFYLNITTLDY